MTETPILGPEYLAGIVDGEGYIGISRTNPSGHSTSMRHAVVLVVTNNDRRLIDWLVDNWGGIVRPHGNGWQWKVQDAQALTLLGWLAPLLIVKAEQARLALTLRDTYPTYAPRLGVPPDVIAQREAIREAIKTANQRLRFPS